MIKVSPSPVPRREEEREACAPLMVEEEAATVMEEKREEEEDRGPLTTTTGLSLSPLLCTCQAVLSETFSPPFHSLFFLSVPSVPAPPLFFCCLAALSPNCSYTSSSSSLFARHTAKGEGSEGERGWLQKAFLSKNRGAKKLPPFAKRRTFFREL